jgi:type I restriction enzyme, S subunit
MFGDPSTNPRGWNTAPLEELVEIGTELVDPNESHYLDLPHIGGEQIEKETGRILSPSTVRESDLRSGKFLFTAEHILYSKIRPYLNKVAYPRFGGVCSADIYPLRIKDRGLSPWYLIGLLRSRAFLEYAQVHSGRLRMPKLNREQLGAFRVPLPDPQLLRLFEKSGVKIEQLDSLGNQLRSTIDRLFPVLLRRAFSGDLTTRWREAHIKELIAEMDHHSKDAHLC